MARAKRTDRAEARRRYRATLIDETEPMELGGRFRADEAEATADRPASRSRARAAAPAPPASRGRASCGAFRAAFRPTDLRGDLAALPPDPPPLVLHPARADRRRSGDRRGDRWHRADQSRR